MMIWKWVKLPKAGALAAFFLPWVTVSCSDQVVAKATGWQLLAGDFTTYNPLTGAEGLRDGAMTPALIAAVILILIGLAASFGRPRLAGLVAATAGIAAGLIGYTVHRPGDRIVEMKPVRRAGQSLIDSVEELRDGAIPAEIMSRDAVTVTWQVGLYAVLILLVVTTLMAAAVAFGSDRRV